MAQYDGAIRIVTKITTKDAKESLSSLEYTIKKSAKEIDSLRSKMDALKDQKIPTKEWKDLEKELSVSKNNLEKLIAKQTEWEGLGVTSGGAWDSLNEEIASASDKVDLIKEKMQALTNAGKDFTLGKDTAEYKSYERQIGYEEKAIEEAGRHYKSLSKTKDGYEKLKKTATSSLQKIGALAKKSAIVPFKALGSVAKNTFSNIEKSAKKSGGTLSAFGSRFKSLVLSLLIFNQISKAFNAMVSGIKEGFGNLYNENLRFQGQIDSLRGSMLTLKNTLASAFSPIVETAIPYIQKLIGWITSAVNALGQLMAALTGRKTYTKAIKQSVVASDDAAKATKKEADAMEDAQEAAEGYLSPLDEINKYNADKDKAPSVSGGAGGTAGDGAGGTVQMFEEVPIESKFQELVDKLKSFIKSEDWEGLGAFIASGINAGLQKIYDAINWDNVGPRITHFVNAFTRTFNSLVDNIDWDLLGRTIGAGINTIVNTLNLLIEGIDWINLGKSFATGIMGIVSEVNWVNLGNLIGNKFMIAWKTFYSFVTNLDYAEIGLALADMINGAVEKIDLGLIMTSLSTFVVGLLEMLSTAIQNTDWTAIGQQIADALRAIDWIGIASGLFDVGLSLINGLLEAFGELPVPVQIAATAIGGFLAAFAISSVISGFIGAIQGVVSVIGGVVSVLGGPLTIAIVAIIAIGALLIANWDKIKKAAGELKDWLVKKWEEIKQKTSDIWDAVKKKIGDVWNAIKTTVSNAINAVKTTVSNIWNAIKTTTSTVWNGIKTTISSIWNGIKSIASSAFNGIKTVISTIWNTLKSLSSSVWNGIKSSLSGIWNSIKSIASSAFNGVKDIVVGIWENLKSATSRAWDGIVSAVRSPINTIIDFLNGLIRGAATAVNSVADMFNSLSIDIPEGVPLVGGLSWHPNLPTWNPGRIPRLATGTVVPPNREFMAVLGDNKREPEVVSPLSTIKQANKESLLEVLSELGITGNGENSNPKTIILQVALDKQVLGKKMIDWGKIQQMSTGNNPFSLGTT